MDGNNKEMDNSNTTIDQIDLKDMQKTFHPMSVKYTFFLNVHVPFSKIYHVLGHKISFNKSKKIDIIPSIFSTHNGMKLEINSRRKTGEITNM